LQPKFLIDNLPEIRVRSDTEDLRKLLVRCGIGPMELANLIASVERTRSCYVERLNTIFAMGFELAHAAGQCARFLHLACSGRLSTRCTNDDAVPVQEPSFYASVLDEALKDFGARVLHSARPLMREADLFQLYSTPPEEVEQQTLYSYREYMQLVDFLVLHRDYELNLSRYVHPPALVLAGLGLRGEKCAFLVRKLGALLGTDLFNAYVEGRTSKRYIRSLYFRNLQDARTAEQTYFECVRRIRVRPRSRLAS
jgi:hypothetical protein